MEEVLRELLVVLGLKTEEKEFEHALIKVELIKKAAEFLVEAAKSAAEGLVEMFKAVAEEGAQFENIAKRTGLSTDAVQELGIAAEATGGDIGAVTSGMRALSMQMYEASQNGSEAVLAFQKLGVRVKDATGKLRPLQDVAADVGEKFEKMADGPEKLALASKLFGRGGGQMIQVLEKMAYWSDEARKAGAIMSEDMVHQASGLDDAEKSLQLTFKGLRNAIVGPLLKPVTELVKRFSDWVRLNREFIATNITNALRALVDIVKVGLDLMRPWIAAFEALVQYGGLLRVALFSIGVALAILFGPILAFMAIVEDLFLFFKYGDKAKTVTGLFVANIEKLVGVLEDKFAKLKTSISESLQGWFTSAIELWKTEFLTFIAWVGEKFSALPGPLQSALAMGVQASPIGSVINSGALLANHLPGGNSSNSTNSSSYAPKMTLNMTVNAPAGSDGPTLVGAIANAVEDVWTKHLEATYAATVGPK